MANDVKLNLTIDKSKAEKSIKTLKGKAQDLQKTMTGVSQKAGLAFAGLAASIGLSVRAYRQQELAVNELNQTLRTQGIYTAELSKQIQAEASALQEVTLYGDEATLQAAALIQSFAGQERVTKDLLEATMNLASAQKMDLYSAASLIGKTIGSSTNALTRYGVEIKSGGTKTEKMSMIIDSINKKWGGMAKNAATGTGSIIQMGNAFGDIQEKIGKEFVPVVEALTGLFGRLNRFLGEHPEIIKYGAAIAGVATAMLGLVAGVAASVAILTKLGLVIGAFTAPMWIAVAAIAAVGVAATDLALNWDKRLAQASAVWSSFAKNITDVGAGIGQFLKGIFTFNMGDIKAGIEQVKASLVNGFKSIVEDESFKESKDTIEKTSAGGDPSKISEAMAANLALIKANNEAKLAAAAEQKALEDEIKQEEKAKERAEKKQLMIDTKKSNEGIAKANAFFRKQEVQSTKEGLGNLATLMNTNSKKLFALGKAAALAQAIINTAQGATKALAQGGIIGPALAATVVAAGLVQIATIKAQKFQGMAAGGLIEGGVPGKDSVPVMAQRDEVIIPPRTSFADIVAAGREITGETQGAGSSAMEVIIGFKDNAIEIIEERILERRELGISAL